MRKSLLPAAVMLSLLLLPLLAHAEQVNLYAAGSLKAALGEVVKAYEKNGGATVKAEYGPSGTLRQRIEREGQAHLFASANMEHPMGLEAAGKGGPVVLFTRNNLCAIAQPDMAVSSSTLLDALLDPKVTVGISTPKSDPAGDYAWELFIRAGKIKPGNFEVLSAKALKLTGAPDSAKAPEGRNQYAWVMEQQKADIFLTYCTNAVLAQREVAGLQMVQIDSQLAVGADYGLVVLHGAPLDAWRLAMFILGVEGQKILASYGFQAGGVPGI
jgi:molybdate transport system substrate-binding protein